MSARLERVRSAALGVLASLLGLARPLFERLPLRFFYVRAARRALAHSGLFDPVYYRAAYAARVSPDRPALVHYLVAGSDEGMQPNPLFDPAHYRTQLPARAEQRVEPLLHYLLFGWRRGFDPHPAFDTGFYLRSNADVRRAGINPLGHFLRYGWREGRTPSPHLDPAAFARVASTQISTLEEIPRAAASGSGPPDRLLEMLDGIVSTPSRPEAADWASLSPRAAEAAPTVDVVVPVHGAADATLRCLYTVLSSRAATPAELVVIDDASPDAALRESLRELARRFGFTLLEQKQNQGFVRSANAGMAFHGDRDVVLLNADTEVYGDWLDRLRRAAYRHPRTASVTPFSNNATICSYPVFDRDNPQPLELSFPELDALAARVNAEAEVELPTCVGFCVYLRRDALDEVGLFDADAFGRGYGEENDWSLRASERGWRHLLAGDVFVRHWGAASFGGSKAARLDLAMRRVRRRHPHYPRLVQAFAGSDPPLHLRAALDRGRLARRLEAADATTLIVSHDRGGGTEQHVRATIDEIHAEGRAVVRLRPSRRRAGEVELFLPEIDDLPNLGPFALDDAADRDTLVAVLLGLRVDTVAVHHLIDLPETATAAVRQLASALGARLTVTVHDYTCVCPRINLIDDSGIYCGEPDDYAVCNACIRKSDSPFGKVEIGAWRERYRRLFAAADEVAVPDDDVAQRLRHYFPDTPMAVRPHEPPVTFRGCASPRRERQEPGEVANVIVLGALNRAKGHDVLRACADEARRTRRALRFTLVGYSRDDAALRRLGVTVTGRYRNAEVARLIEAHRADVVWLPSVWPETYSYTLSLVLPSGRAIAAFDLGAIAGRLRRLDRTEGLMPLEWVRTPERINSRLAVLASDRRTGAGFDEPREEVMPCTP